MAKLFSVPFAASGDKAVIPVAAQPSGSVSYTEGFGLDYERNPETDPQAKRIPRDETNQLYYDLTSEVGVMQLWGSPNWFAPSDNEGVPVSYGLGAVVRHNGVRYESLVESNTAEPGTDPAKWGVVNPFNLSGITATQGEVNGATISSKFVSPLTLASAIRTGALSGGAATRVTTAYSVSLNGSFVLGSRAAIEFTSPDASPAGPLTLNVDGTGAQPLKTSTGGDLAAGDLVAGRTYVARYDGTNWVLVSSVASQFVSAGAASETQAGITRYATETEGNELTVNNVAMTPGRVPLATITQRGVARAATSTEVANGLLLDVFVSPATLKGAAASLVPASRTITAGNGLTGGGNLSADRSISMGTPSTISASSSNTATGNTHTHSLENLPISKITDLQSALDAKFNVGGGTINGNSQISRGNAFTTFGVSANAGNAREYQLLTAGVLRWTVRANTTAESGANAGSNLEIRNYADDGSGLGVVVTFDRASGAANFVTRPSWGGITPYDSNNLSMATAAQYRSNAAGTIPLTPSAVWSAAAFVTLNQAATIAVNLSNGFNFTTTMTGNRTLGNPTNTKVGQVVTIEFVQDGTGGRTLTWGSNWLFAGGIKPALSTAIGARDVFTGIVLPSGAVYGSLAKGVS